MNTPELHGHYEALRNDLLNVLWSNLQSRVVLLQVSMEELPIFLERKTPNTQPLFMSNQVTHDFGKTVGWHDTRPGLFKKLLHRFFSYDYQRSGTEANGLQKPYRRNRPKW
ncbi:MAG: hypothetical protein R2822_03435 [Spirosomataceae bacterium]